MICYIPPAAELLLTGRNIPAQEALQLGLVNAVVPDDQVEAKALEFAKAIAANSPDSIIVLMHGKWQGLPCVRTRC